MTLKFSPISSPGGSRELFIDCAGALEADEQLTQVTIVSAYTSVLTVSNVAINSSDVTFEEKVTKAGQGAQFTVETIQESRATVPLIVSIEGDSGTKEKYEVSQPISTVLTR